MCVKEKTYAIICGQGTSFQEWVCMTESQIFDLYEELYDDLDLMDEEQDSWREWVSLEFIADLWEVTIFESDKPYEQWRFEDLAESNNLDIYGDPIKENSMFYQYHLNKEKNEKNKILR